MALSPSSFVALSSGVSHRPELGDIVSVCGDWVLVQLSGHWVISGSALFLLSVGVLVWRPTCSDTPYMTHRL